MNIIAKILRGGGDKTLTYLLAGVFALAAIDAWADIKWIGGSGGSEAEPIDIYDSAKWNPNYLPSSSQVLWFENVTEPTVLTNCVENPATTAISGNAAINGGPFTFLGDYKWNGTLYIKLNYNGATSITKKGDWTVGNEMYLGFSDNAEPVSFTNETGNLQVGSSSAKHDLRLGYGVGTSVTVEKNAGDWKLYGAMQVAEGSNSDVKFYHRGGNLVVAGNLVVQTHGSGEFYMEGGHVTVSNMVRFGEHYLSSGNKANVYLNGGVFEAKAFRFHNCDSSAAASFIFNGGTYKAMADGHIAVYEGRMGYGYLRFKVGAQGGTIDTAGYDVVSPFQLLKDGDSTGGLCVKGGGSLALSSDTITYNNKIFLEAGTTLAVSNDTAAANILANGIELTGTPEFDKGYTVFVSNKELAESDLDNITCSVAEIAKSIGADGKSIVVTVTALKPGYWTGAKDNNLSDPGNWSDRNVPTSGNANIFCTTSSTLTKGATFAPSSITFLEGSAAVTIVGDAISGIASITNLSSVSHTINVPVYFTGDIQVKQAAMAETGDLTKAHVTFAGGAYAADGHALESGNSAARYSRCIFGKYYLKSTSTSRWTAQYQGGSKRVCVADGSYLYVPYAGNTKELYVGNGAKVVVADMAMTTDARFSYKNYGEMVVTNAVTPESFQSDDLFLTWNQEVATPSVFRFISVTNKNEKGKYLYFADGNKATKTTLYFGAGGVGFSGDGLTSTSCIIFGKDANNNETIIRPWDSDFTIGGKSNGGNGIRFSKRVIFNTDDDSGVDHTITLEAIYYGGTGASVDVGGSGTLLVTGQNTGGNALPMTVTDTATLAVGTGGSLGTSTITLGAGTKLALTAASSSFTPLANAVTLPTGENEKATIRIDGERLKSGDHTILSGVAAGATANVNLDMTSAALDGRKATLRVDRGNLILNIEPNGTLIIIR